jgi:TfoX/Sxy family transcriptional regulator of competence genes
MATSVDYIEFVCEQIAGMGAVRYKKMFGEYMVYVNDKPILLVCDDTAFVKMAPALDALSDRLGNGFPYDGAKEHYSVDVDDKELLCEIIGILEPITSVPKPKKKKNRDTGS